MDRPVTKIFHDLIVGNPVFPFSVAELADLLGKGTPTLYAELRPHERADGKPSEKLSVDDALILMLETGEAAPLRYMAGALGYRLEREEACAPDKATLAEELVDDLPHLAEFQSAMRTLNPTRAEDTQTVRALRDRLVRELDEDVCRWERGV